MRLVLNLNQVKVRINGEVLVLWNASLFSFFSQYLLAQKCLVPPVINKLGPFSSAVFPFQSQLLFFHIIDN